MFVTPVNQLRRCTSGVLGDEIVDGCLHVIERLR